jgi:hypothetical protein
VFVAFLLGFCSQVTSQHPYAEEFIGAPNVITVDIDDKVEVEKAIKKALNSPPPEVSFE